MAERRAKGRSTEDDAKERARRLHAEGMPYQLAMAVALGKTDLSEALERMARRDRVERLQQEHGLSRALATQVAMGQLDLEMVLRRRRLAEHRRQNRHQTWLSAGRQLKLGLHGEGEVIATIGAVGAYDLEATIDGQTRTIRKLQVKYAYESSDWKQVKKALRVDRALAGRKLGPIERPQDRYGCSDKRLFNYVDTGVDVAVVLLEGEQLKGNVVWFSRYEFTLRLRSGAEVGVFRHALYRVTS